ADNLGTDDTKSTQSQESTLVSPAKPALETTASPGITLDDRSDARSGGKACLSRGYPPDGLVSAIAFTLTLDRTRSFKADRVTTFSVVDTVSGNGEYDASYRLPRTGVVTGTCLWHAVYSGDADNLGTDDTKSAQSQESTLVSPAKPALVTTASPGITLDD